MYINDISYGVNLSDVQLTRDCLLHMYDFNSLSRLSELMSKHIPCLDITFNAINHTFLIKIKKTEMRKIRSFKQNVEFYYQLVGQAFLEFLMEYEPLIVSKLSNYYGIESNEKLYSFIQNPKKIYGLFNVYCIANNIIEIQL